MLNSTFPDQDYVCGSERAKQPCSRTSIVGYCVDSITCRFNNICISVSEYALPVSPAGMHEIRL